MTGSPCLILLVRLAELGALSLSKAFDITQDGCVDWGSDQHARQCRQPLTNISGPPAQQAAPAQQQTGQQPQPQQQPHRVRREDENSVVVRGTCYTKLECVGRGGSSKVAYRDTMCLLENCCIGAPCLVLTLKNRMSRLTSVV